MSDQLPFILRDLGRVPYDDAFALQKELQQAVIGGRDDPTHPMGYLLLLEHDPPVITVSRRKTARQHLVATPAMLDDAGVTVAETDRGGDITYHGPGQLVAYPILDLNRMGLRLHGYMRFLEDVVIDTLAAFGIAAGRDPDATGVWVENDPSPEAGADGAKSKICAMGVRISRWVSMHGLALNVTTNLDHFNLIVPCGLAGRGVTSLEQLLGDERPTMDEVKRVLVREMSRRMQTLSRTAASNQTASG